VTERSIGGLLDSLGITVDVEAGEHLVEAIVIAWLTLEEDPDAPDTACPCFPTPEHVLNPAGRDGWLLVHHSLDGREQHEQASADTAQETK
jgi:hypothetical protein